MAPSLGRGCWRLKTASCWRRGEVFEHQTAARPKPAKHGSEPEPKQVKHGNQVIADRLCRLPCEVVDFTAGQDCDEAQSEELRSSTAPSRAAEVLFWPWSVAMSSDVPYWRPPKPQSVDRKSVGYGK